MTLTQVIDKLRDGSAYVFTNPRLKGFFYKAPYPADPVQTRLDGAHSAVTYWDKKVSHQLRSPVMLLDDFDCDDWTCEPASHHPQMLPARSPQREESAL